MAGNGTRSNDLFPSRQELKRIEHLLTRLRFECEDVGWWPGSLTVPGLREETGALGLLWELQLWRDRLLEESRSRRKPLQLAGINGEPVTNVFVTGASLTEIDAARWPPFWTVEIDRVLKSLGTAINLLVTHWRKFTCEGGAPFQFHAVTVDDDEREYLVPGSHKMWLSDGLADDKTLIVPPELAAVLERCTQRLRVILAEGPVDGFIPSARQQLILDKLNGRALKLEELADEIGTDKSGLHRLELKELMEHDMVMNDRRKGGYYRPDAPPK